MYNKTSTKQVKSAEYYDELYKKFVKSKVSIDPLTITDSMGNHRFVGNTSLSHYPQTKVPHRTTLKMSWQGRVVKAQISYTNDQKPHGGKRGTVSTFSQASRKRLLELFARLEAIQPVFLTLTYGDDYPDVKTAKNNLRAFLERIRRKYPDRKISAVWRLEFQDRGAPHFHLIFFGLPFINKRLIQIWWTQIIKQPWPFTRIEQVRGVRGLMFYCSKYVAKPLDFSGFNSPTYLHALKFPGVECGRVWGIYNRENLPFCPLSEIEVKFCYEQFMVYRAIAARMRPQIADQLSWGFTLFVDYIQGWEDLFHNLFDIPF